MTKLKLNKSQILLFKAESAPSYQCQLKKILAFLKYQGMRPPLKFNYAGPDAPLIGNLSLQENIYLESLPRNLSSSCKNTLFLDYLKLQNNDYLQQFYNEIPDKDQLAGEADIAAKKMVSLINVLLGTAPVFIFERPEKYISKDQLELFVNALNSQIKNQSRLVMVSSPREKYWAAHAKQSVSQAKSQYYFQELQESQESNSNKLDEVPLQSSLYNKYVA